MPSHVFAISGWMPPWFQANELLPCGGMKMHGCVQFAAPVKKK